MTLTAVGLAGGAVTAPRPLLALAGCQVFSGLLAGAAGPLAGGAAVEETVSWGVIIEDPGRVRLNAQRYDALRSSAVFEEEAHELLDQISRDLRRLD